MVQAYDGPAAPRRAPGGPAAHTPCPRAPPAPPTRAPPCRATPPTSCRPWRARGRTSPGPYTTGGPLGGRRGLAARLACELYGTGVARWWRGRGGAAASTSAPPGRGGAGPQRPRCGRGVRREHGGRLLCGRAGRLCRPDGETSTLAGLLRAGARRARGGLTRDSGGTLGEGRDAGGMGRLGCASGRWRPSRWGRAVRRRVHAAASLARRREGGERAFRTQRADARTRRGGRPPWTEPLKLRTCS
jgi:hypothetical protein